MQLGKGKKKETEIKGERAQSQGGDGKKTEKKKKKNPLRKEGISERGDRKGGRTEQKSLQERKKNRSKP